MGELVKPADRDHRAGDGAGSKRAVLVVALTQAQQEGRDVLGDDLPGLGNAARCEEVRVASQIPAI